MRQMNRAGIAAEHQLRAALQSCQESEIGCLYSSSMAASGGDDPLGQIPLFRTGCHQRVDPGLQSEVVRDLSPGGGRVALVLPAGAWVDQQKRCLLTRQETSGRLGGIWQDLCATEINPHNPANQSPKRT